ncbi:cell division initiation protein [Streptomyces albidoflavus]|uniref:cell division initiation protein n=1 Tax=Streptomyces TaxID=1883 RepID=UPI001165516E|nr:MULTISPECIES: cell division initiation protein [Streptomyces]MCG5119721.1 cell division initiation protein [Streptomyces sp. T7(2022)]MCR0990539.1 cell division initiation protein [Streptomyces albidoflavus]QDD58426.1 cell division initiation protein [Streptomyces albidoflavus]
MDVQKKLDEIVDTVGSARSMPMSASCVINRAELLALLEEVREALPGSLAQAQELIGDREQLVEQARQEAERIIQSAHAERGTLVSGTAVAQRSQDEADRILAEARAEAEEIRAQADDYVDSKLANFEVVLTKTIGSVGRGREKLLGADLAADDGYEDPDAPERSHDPETLRRRADDYVSAKLGAFEAVLGKTLEAVGRGRQKLHGRIATDELAALGELGDEAAQAATSDADYLAGLAGPATPQPPAATPPAPPVPAAPPAPPQNPYAGQAPPAAQDPYGYGAPAQQDAYAYQQQEYAPQQAAPYGYQDQQQSGAYGYGQQGGQQGYPQQGYQAQGGYDAAGYAVPPVPQERPANALDETSLFDTSMISAEELRRYEQGR